jgi:hypothetical protein
MWDGKAQVFEFGIFARTVFVGTGARLIEEVPRGRGLFGAAWHKCGWGTLVCQVIFRVIITGTWVL